MLNWNDVERTRRAVASLLAQSTPSISVIVVDNGSAADDSAALARCFVHQPVTVLALPENVGFARAVNAGAIAALRTGADFILLFNNDAYIDPGSTAIRDCLAALQADPTLGAAGPIISNDDERRTVQSGSYALSMWFPIPRANRNVTRRASLTKNSYLSGSCLLIRAGAFATVGGLDPDFFLYGDDFDFARRLRVAGYGQQLISARGIAHARAASTRVGSANYVYTALRSNLILVRKHAHWYQLPSAFATCFAASFALAALGIANGYGAAPYAAFRSWRDFFLNRWGGYAGSRLETVPRPSLADKQRPEKWGDPHVAPSVMTQSPLPTRIERSRIA